MYYNERMSFEKITKELKKEGDPGKAAFFPSFFKTGKGEYGEGDRFLGVTVPKQRKIAQKHIDASFETIQKLLDSKFHEQRMTAVLILVYKFQGADDGERKNIYTFYLKKS